MKFKSLTLGLILLSSLHLSTATSYSFKYAYLIQANSYSNSDKIAAFKMKELVVDKYEKLCFSFQENYYNDILKARIKEFEFNKNINAEYYHGMIMIKIGTGKGYQIKGDLKRNSCDDSTITEKFFF